MKFISDFVNSIKDTITTGFEYISDIVDIFKEIYNLIVEFINFLPSPYNIMTLITAGIFFAITIWRVIKK